MDNKIGPGYVMLKASVIEIHLLLLFFFIKKIGIRKIYREDGKGQKEHK